MKNILTQSLAKYFFAKGENGDNVLVTSHNYDKAVSSLKTLNATRTAKVLIFNFFSPINALVSRPVFSVSANKVVVYIFYNISANNQALNSNTVNNLGKKLTMIFGKTVEMRLVKQHYPYLDSYILAQYIAINTQDYKLEQIIRRIFSSSAPTRVFSREEKIELPYTPVNNLPSHIVGIKVKVSGRLIMERSRPRQTVQTMEIGTFSKINLAIVDSASFTSKNKKGAFTVKVWISQRAIV
jgi:ribosomal protein S3